VAEAEGDFDRWRAAQLEAAAPPTTPEQTRGAELVEYRCGLCHRVRGTDAGAISAPDLTHLMSRRTIAAGALLNNPGNLAGWVENSQALKPGNLMPNQYLSGQQLTDTLAYLETLK
jgi:cytochrome c oxidase subunit 2